MRNWGKQLADFVNGLRKPKLRAKRKRARAARLRTKAKWEPRALKKERLVRRACMLETQAAELEA